MRNLISYINFGGNKMKENGITVEVQKVEGKTDTLVFNCVGYIDTYNSPHFSQIVDAEIKNEVKNLIFDLSKVSYISSTGIGTFPAFLKNVVPKGGNIVLIGMKDRVREVFQLLGFASFFNKADSVKEAFSFFPESEVPVSNIHFKKMEDIVGSFDKLERFIIKDKQREFYEVFIQLLREIQSLKN